MALTTFIVGLDQLSIQTLEEVVTARGIERVIVVATNTDFVDNSSQIAAISSNTQVQNLRNDGVQFSLAVNDGSSLNISNAAYENIKTSDLSFLTSDEFASVTASTTIVSGDVFTNNSSDVTVFPEFSASGNTIGAISTDENFGTPTSITAVGGSFSAFSDFNGSIQLNLTANEFASILAPSADPALVEDIRYFSNISVETFNSPTDTSIHLDENGDVKENHNLEDNEYFLTHYKYDFDIDGPIQEFNGSNRLPNFSENKLDDRSNTSSFIYLDGITETVYLSALQVLIFRAGHFLSFRR